MNNFMKRGGDEQEMEGMFRTPQVLSKSYTSTVLDLYLDSEIGSPDKYREIYHALSNAGHQDYIVLHVNSVGGRMDAGLQIINHIINCLLTQMENFILQFYLANGQMHSAIFRTLGA